MRASRAGQSLSNESAKSPEDEGIAALLLFPRAFLLGRKGEQQVDPQIPRRSINRVKTTTPASPPPFTSGGTSDRQKQERRC